MQAGAGPCRALKVTSKGLNQFCIERVAIEALQGSE